MRRASCRASRRSASTTVSTPNARRGAAARDGAHNQQLSILQLLSATRAPKHLSCVFVPFFMKIIGALSTCMLQKARRREKVSLRSVMRNYDAMAEECEGRFAVTLPKAALD
jgi:hypothetical protein